MFTQIIDTGTVSTAFCADINGVTPAIRHGGGQLPIAAEIDFCGIATVPGRIGVVYALHLVTGYAERQGSAELSTVAAEAWSDQAELPAPLQAATR